MSQELTPGVGPQRRVSWRPIETAPQDGTEFMAWITNTVTGAEFWSPRCRYAGERLMVWDYSGPESEGWGWLPHLAATHWMPVPEAPADS